MAKRRRRCRYYVVDLGQRRGRREVYVGSTSGTPEQRYAKHKAGGRTSVGAVRRRGRGLVHRKLAASAHSESELRAELQRRGYDVRGSAKPFRPTKKRRVRKKPDKI